MSTTELLAFIFGVTFVAALLAVGVFIMVRDRPVPSQAMFIFRVVLALAAGGVGAVLPGLIDIEIGSTGQFLLRAGGALALTVLVYLVNPPDRFEHIARQPNLAKPQKRRRKAVPPLPENGLEK